MGGGDNHQPLGWNAHRHQSSPIGQPRYRFQDVQKCQKSLEGSVVQEISNTREAFKEIMAEMVLLCTEAIKRSRSGRTASKPLSLEYIADRLDVDDPCFGYIIRSAHGHLQGFITVTTFTNWQKQFSWDSLQEMSFYYDDDDDDGDDDGDGDHGCGNSGHDANKSNDPKDGEEKQSASTPSTGEVDNNHNNSTKKKSPPPRTPCPGDNAKTPKKNIDNAKTPKKNIQQKRRKRIIDEDGSLAKELEKTVRLGDPYSEGIVWPRIAEISLLGALGCGRVLVQLVIEQLEFQRAMGSANYDYIALQATDNSIPFYESLGFVRVGAVCYDTKQEQQDGSSDNDDGDDSRPSSPAFSMTSTATGSSTAVAAEATELGTPSEKKLVMPKTIVASPNCVHEVVRPGESPNDIAKRFKVCVWDIVFLNKDIYPDLKPTSRLIKGTQLYVPETQEEEAAAAATPPPVTAVAAAVGNDQKRHNSSPAPETPTKWFVAKENDTPRKIAKQFGIACNKLVSGNRRRLPELQATSRLRAGTRLKVSNLDQQDKICQPYCHWSFPEDTAVEGGDPSYMMVYKLDRKTARNPRTVRDSLAVPVGKYSPPRLLFPPPPRHEGNDAALTVTEAQLRPPRLPRGRNGKAAVDLKFPKEPKQPDELKKTPPESGKDIYWGHQKELHPEFIRPTPEKEKIIRDRWSRLGNYKKERYHGVATEGRKIYKRIEREYKGELSRWKRACDKIREEHDLEVQRKHAEIAASNDKENSLFNKVIKLREDALEGKDNKYWFVLTYIPDLKWCHLAPMVQEGHFGPDRKRSYGRPRYRLVDEKLGKELDISSMYCIPLKSKALKRTADADKEEWDIIDGAVELVKEDVGTNTTSALSSSASASASAIGSTQKKKNISKQPKFPARTPVKPLNGKISIGSTPRHSQDPLKRTRASPSMSGRKRRIEEISLEVKLAAAKVATPIRERQRRRCMRCIDNGAIPTQAIECVGAKGRFGRDACEYFDANGASRKESAKGVVVDNDEKKEETKIVTKGVANTENNEVTLASPSPKPSRRPSASTSPTHPAWSSPTRSSTNGKLKLSADERKDDTETYEHTPRKSRRLGNDE